MITLPNELIIYITEFLELKDIHKLYKPYDSIIRKVLHDPWTVPMNRVTNIDSSIIDEPFAKKHLIVNIRLCSLHFLLNKKSPFYHDFQGRIILHAITYANHKKQLQTLKTKYYEEFKRIIPRIHYIDFSANNATRNNPALTIDDFPSEISKVPIVNYLNELDGNNPKHFTNEMRINNDIIIGTKPALIIKNIHNKTITEIPDSTTLKFVDCKNVTIKNCNINWFSVVNCENIICGECIDCVHVVNSMNVLLNVAYHVFIVNSTNVLIGHIYCCSVRNSHRIQVDTIRQLRFAEGSPPICVNYVYNITKIPDGVAL